MLLLFSVLTIIETAAVVLLFQVAPVLSFLVFAVINLAAILLLSYTKLSESAVPASPDGDECIFGEETYDTNGMYDPTLKIAHETLPVLRRGLNATSAKKTADIIMKIAEVPGIAITDREHVLTFLGVGCEHHMPGTRIKTEATKEVIATGKMKVVHTPEGLCCPSYHEGCRCPLNSAVIVPLRCRDEIVGALKLYQVREGAFPHQAIRLAIGLAELLSLQVELAELDGQRQLLTEAKLEALNAQINPHFFFNTLNTIISFSRTNPEKARELLVHLAGLFRQTLNRHGSLTTLREELECVSTYLILEKARFGDKLNYVQDIPEELMDYSIPVLSLQPLVENAINHGLMPKEEPGTVTISGRLVDNELHLSVKDDGVSIPAEKTHLVLQPGYGSGSGVGLSNVNLRFQSLYGKDHGLRVESKNGHGTTVYLRVPVTQDAVLQEHVS